MRYFKLKREFVLLIISDIAAIAINYELHPLLNSNDREYNVRAIIPSE